MNPSATKQAKHIRRVKDTFSGYREQLRTACSDLILAVQTSRKPQFEDNSAMDVFHVLGALVALVLIICAGIGDSFWVGQLLESGFATLNVDPTLAIVGIPAILITIEAVMIGLCAKAEEEFEETAYLTASFKLRLLRIGKFLPVFLLLVGVLWARWGVFSQMLSMDAVPVDYLYASLGHDLTFILIAVGSHVAAALVGRWLFESVRAFGQWITHFIRRKSYKHECRKMQQRIDAVDQSYLALNTFRSMALEDHPELSDLLHISYIEMEVQALQLVYGENFHLN